MTVTETAKDHFPRIVTALPGPRAAAIIERDKRSLSPSYTRAYPLVAESGEGALITDIDGNRFLDFNAGIAVAATGHCHPRVVSAVQGQAAKLIHMSGTDFYYENLVQLAEKLGEIAPGDVPRRVYFGNSGTEATEAALKLARYVTGRDQFIAFYGGFHGRTMGSLSLTASKAVQRKGFGSLLGGVFHAPYPDLYRSGKSEEECSAESLGFIEEVLFHKVVSPAEVAAILVEPIQGEGGYLVPPKGFLAGLRALTERHGILLICDEVQSGMGRTGKWWASDHFGIVPDIINSAKGIASGLPLSATIARADLMQWKPGAHASTFGGNPVAIAASLATIELLEEGLLDNAAEMGRYMMERLREWPSRFRHVGDVRGLGLMLGIEIVRDQETRERAPELRDALVHAAFERGLLVLGAGENTLRLSPPLVITRAHADVALGILEDILQEFEQRG